MSNQSTFRSYWKHLWSNHLHQAKPWARDQILWALVVIIVIPFLAALRVGKKIDAPFIWTCLEFYFVVAVIYAAVHVLRAGWKAYQERDRVIGERDGHIQRLGEIMTERANQAQQQSFQHSCEIARANRVQKELNEARVDLINAKDKLESLTWPNDRPKLS